MSYNRETLPQITSRIDADLNMRLGEARLPRGRRQAVARVDAASHYGHDIHIDHLTKQIFPRTADDENLKRHASFWKITPKAPAYAYGQAEVKGNIGSVIAANYLLTRSDGLEYASQGEITLSQATMLLDVICQRAGKQGNCSPGEALTPVQPLLGITSITVKNISNGTDEESRERLVERIEARAQRTPQGGNLQDYVNWALEVPGVTRAWAYPLRDPESNKSLGLVAVAFVCDDQDGSIIPDVNKVKEVQAHLESKAPCPGDVVAFALTEKPLDLRIAKLKPDTEATRKAIYEELSDLLFREATPGGGLLVSHIREAISIAIGEYDHELLLPLADIVSAANELLVMGQIAWGEE